MGFIKDIDGLTAEDMRFSFIVSIGYLTFEEVRIVSLEDMNEEKLKNNTIISQIGDEESTAFRISIPNMEIRKGLKDVSDILNKEVIKTTRHKSQKRNN